MKGVPLRVEIGPKDMEKGQCCICRRDSGEKIFVPLAELETTVPQLLDAVHNGLYERAKKNLEDHTRVCLIWTRSRSLWRPRAALPRPCGAAIWSASSR